MTKQQLLCLRLPQVVEATFTGCPSVRVCVHAAYVRVHPSVCEHDILWNFTKFTTSVHLKTKIYLFYFFIYYTSNRCTMS